MKIELFKNNGYYWHNRFIYMVDKSCISSDYGIRKGVCPYKYKGGMRCDDCFMSLFNMEKRPDGICEKFTLDAGMVLFLHNEEE